MTAVEETRAGDVVVLTLVHDLDATVLPECEQRVERLLAEGLTRVVWDLSSVEMLPSTGAGFLLQTAARVRQAGGRMALCGLAPRVRGTLATMGVLDALRIRADRAAAIGAVS